MNTTWLLGGLLIYLLVANGGDQHPGASPRGVAPPGGPPPVRPAQQKPPPAFSVTDPSTWFGAAAANADKIGESVVSVYDVITRSSAGGKGPSPVDDGDAAMATDDGYDGAETPVGDTPDESGANWNADLDQDAPTGPVGTVSYDYPDPVGDAPPDDVGAAWY